MTFISSNILTFSEEEFLNCSVKIKDRIFLQLILKYNVNKDKKIKVLGYLSNFFNFVLLLSHSCTTSGPYASESINHSNF